MQNLHQESSNVADYALVDRVQQGDSSAFSILMLRHHERCFRIAMSVLHARQDAEDEVQNAFLSAYKHINQFRKDAEFTTWLTRIVVNQCRMNLRKARRSRVVYGEKSWEDTRQFEVEAKGQSPFQELYGKQLIAALLGEVRRLPPMLREILVRTHLQELPVAVVAGELGISEAAAKSRLLRARNTLKERVAKCGVGHVFPMRNGMSTNKQCLELATNGRS